MARPDFGYYSSVGKCWLVTMLDEEKTARSIFEETVINITTEGWEHLVVALGPQFYFEQYINSRVEEWVGQVTKLAKFALLQPQACYNPFPFGLRHHWAYFLRTLPDIDDLLLPLERAIADALIPSITGHNCTQAERELLVLLVKMAGMGLINLSQMAALEYAASGPLAQQIKSQAYEPPDDNEVHTVQWEML